MTTDVLVTTGVSLFGLKLSSAEWSLALEIIKALLLLTTAATSALVFNLLAKKREQDTSLFNELVKPRIIAMHNCNQHLIGLVTPYVELLERLSKYSNSIPNPANSARFTYTNNSFILVNEFRSSLPVEVEKIEKYFNSMRYQLGEHGFSAQRRRLRYFQERVAYHWRFYDTSVDKWHADLARLTPDLDEEKEKNLRLAIAEIIASVAYRETIDLIKIVHDDFEQVILSKGRGRRFYEPVTNDSFKGMLRLNPLEEDARQKLSRLLDDLNRFNLHRGTPP